MPSSPTTHLHIVGSLSRQRLAAPVLAGRPHQVVRCHRNRRGPYSGVDQFVRCLLVDAMQYRPGLVDQSRVMLLYGMPELAEVIGSGPRDLAASSDFAERTRFFGASMIRCMSQGVVTFIQRYLESRAEAPSMVVFDEVHEAARTTQEFLALLLRRVPADRLQVVIASTGELDEELRSALGMFAIEQAAPSVDVTLIGEPTELADRYLETDGAEDDPACLQAYQDLSDSERTARHDRRADDLADGATWSVEVGALAYHREHGSDPHGLGVAALAHATQLCTEAGFSEMVVELGYRGRAETPAEDETTFRKLTIQVSSALIPSGRLDEAIELLHDLRRRYASPLVHMMTSYSLAMMNTRFLTPRDHEKAVEWQNSAIAIASILPDDQDRLMFIGFQDNAMALIQMHRGRLAEALELIEGALNRADLGMDDDAYQLHRSQLLYNRARLLNGLGRKDEAYQLFTVLSELDPHYTDYLSERAKISRRRGDLAAALADYDRAVELGPPFPELLYNRGSALMEQGELEAARADFDLVLDMEPDDLETRVIRAELLLALDRPEDARADVTAGLLLRPEDARLRCLSGILRLSDGDRTGAIKELTAALELDPDYPAALVNRAVAWFESGDPDAAVEDLTRALVGTGDDPDLLLNRGLARAAAGDPDGAIADFDRALELPDADLDELRLQRNRLGVVRN